MTKNELDPILKEMFTLKKELKAFIKKVNDIYCKYEGYRYYPDESNLFVSDYNGEEIEVYFPTLDNYSCVSVAEFTNQKAYFNKLKKELKGKVLQEEKDAEEYERGVLAARYKALTGKEIQW